MPPLWLAAIALTITNLAGWTFVAWPWVVVIALVPLAIQGLIMGAHRKTFEAKRSPQDP